MKSLESPNLQVSKGMEIGYSSSWMGRRRKPLSLAISDQEINLESGTHLLLARNGRGKSTFLKTVAKCNRPLQGTIKVKGSVQYVSEDLSFDKELTPLCVFAALLDRKKRRLAKEYADFLELPTSVSIGKLSKGNRQKLLLVISEAQASGDSAQVLLLDEPFNGLDFFARQRVKELWDNQGRNHLRLLCIHPDEQTLTADGVITINENRIRWSQANRPLVWENIRETLV